MPERRYTLGEAKSVPLDATGSGEVAIGPEVRGPANWLITGVILQTSRPGQAPIPRAQVWAGDKAPANSLGLSYDGSFAQGICNVTLTRGQQLICRWDGGQSGDVASLTVTGDKW